MSYSTKLKPRGDHINKDGTVAVYLWVTINRKTKKYSLGKSIELEKWDYAKSKVRGTTPAIAQLNKLLEQKKSRANDI